jgi:hypothetical protein
VQFGDDQLGNSLSSTEEAWQQLSEKKQEMKQYHDEILRRHGLAPKEEKKIEELQMKDPAEQGVPSFDRPLHLVYQRHVGGSYKPEDQADSDHGYQSAEEGEEHGRPSRMQRYQSAEEAEAHGPSRMRRVASGIKHAVTDYAIPVTRHLILPAMGEAAKHGFTFARLMGKAAWTAGDVISFLTNGEEAEDGEPHFSHNSSSSSNMHALGSGADAELEELSQKGKGYLVEEIYRQPGWARAFDREDSRGYTTDDTNVFRRKLSKMSPHDLAEVLINLKGRH